MFRKLRLILLLLFAAVYSGYAQAPVAGISATPTTSICPGQAISFADASTGGAPTSWLWTFPSGSPSSSNSSSVAVVFPTAGTYTVTLKVTNASGSSTKSVIVTVHSVPVADFFPNKTMGCFPTYIQFTNTSTADPAEPIISYSWTFGDGTQDNVPNPNHHYTIGGTLPVTLYVKNQYGCVGTAQIKNLQKAITLTGQVVANFSYTLNTSCTLPLTATFTNTSGSGPGILNYLWDFGDGSPTDNTFAPTHSYTSAGNDTARLTVTSNQGCSDVASVPVTISPSGNITDFTMPDTVCVNTVVNFTNTSSPYPNSSDWLYGDGSPADINKHNGQHTYTVPGTYPVKLTNTFSLCGGVSPPKNIVVVAPPVTSFTGTNLISCKAPLTSTFTDASTGATSWIWDFGDGSPTVNGQGPQSHTYNKIGDFTVTLNTSAVSGCSSSKTLMVHIDTPIVRIVGMPAYGCAPYTFTPTASVTAIDGIASYSWIMGNGNTSSSATPPPQTYPVGTFTMYVTITTTGGCQAKDSGIIKVGSIKPVPSFTWAPPTICVKTFVNFSGLAPGADQWKWDFGDGSTNTTSPSPIYRYTKPGTYTVKFTAYNSGCWDTISHTIVVDAPQANFSYSSILCSKNNYQFTDKSVGPPTGWIWDFGDGSAISNTTNPTHPYAAGAPTTYTVQLIASTATCKDTIKLPVKVNQTTTLAFSPSGSICANTPVTITATAFGNIGKYIWVYGDGKRDTTTGNTTSHTYLTPNAAYPVKVITIDPTSGCVDSSAAYSMTVNGPTAFFSGPPPVSCGATTVKFTDLSTDVGSSIVTWAWDFGDGGTSTAQSPSYLYANQGNFVARLTVTDGNGCSSTYDTAKPMAVSIMVPKYILSDSLTCPNAPKQTKFINSSIGGFNPVYSWSFGDGTFSTIVSPTHVYTSVNRFYDTLTMTDTYGCVAKFGGPPIRVDTPYAAFTMSGNYSNCPVFNDTFHFTGHYADSLSWDFTDGGVSNLLTPVNGYALPGDYYPFLQIMSPGGCLSVSAPQHVHIDGPVGNLTYSPTAACDSLTVNFSVAPTNAISFLWIPGDGSASVKNTTPNFQYTYTIPGQFTPIVYLTDALGCTLSKVGKTFINIDQISSASFIADKYIVCDTGIVNFKNTSMIGIGTKITDFRWDFGDGVTTNGPGDSIIAHKYTTLGNDSVTMTMTSFGGCSATHKVGVQIVPSPKISFTGLLSQCAPGVMNYAGVETVLDPNQPVSWSWVFGNGQTATGQAQPGIAYPKAGEYVVYVTAKNAKGCSTMTDTAGPATHLFIYPIPSVNAGIDATICDTSSLQLNATGTATSYAWDPPANGNLSTLIGPSPVATSPISTFFVVHGTSLNGCTARDTINVTVNTPLTITATGTDSVCIGQSVTLNATGAAQYVWTPSAGLNNPNIANPIATPDTSQIGAGSSAVITYSVTGTDNKKCYTDTKTVDVTAFKNPVIGLVPNATINVGSSYQINSTASTNIVSLNWTPANNLSCTNCLTPVASPTMTTKYSLTAINDGGCATTESIKVQVICTGANFFVPNSFSPNGDGVNDYFIVNGVGLNVIPSITIYNRWGQMVFQKSNFAPNSASQAWDGTFNGKPAPADVYIYTIQILCENATLIPYHGNVTLIR